MDELERWLEPLGLAPLAAVLRAHDIDLEVLLDLTETDLERLGISLGHRRKLLKAASVQQRPLSDAASTTATTSSAGPSAERRQLTVMFCDLVGSTALAAKLDPEELRDVLRLYQDAVAGEIARFGGHVAQFLGDGVLAYFGWPHAHEHEAERAVRAGLAAVEATTLIPMPRGAVPAARAGIATGLVVVSECTGHEETAVGETPNLAARLQAMAGPNEVVIETHTWRLLGDLFEYRNLGAIELKGVHGPVRAFQVLRPSALESRFEALHPSGLAGFVGRGEEIELLHRRWERAKTDGGQVVLISGEPGIGKSRLAVTLLERIADEPHTRLRFFCSPHHTNSALHPVISHLEHGAGFERNDDSSSKLDKLDAMLGQTSTSGEDRRLIAELLRISDLERYPVLEMSPQQKKHKTFDALTWQLQALARQKPVLEIFEDMHWIDPTSLELLDRTVECIRRLPVLLLVTFRPDVNPPWIGQSHVTILTLGRLDHRDGAALIKGIAGNNALAPDIMAEIVERTDGIPLFVEELTKAVLEASVDGVDAARALSMTPSQTVPATLHASLMARLDRLGQAKAVAQIGSAIGREFSYEILAAISPLSDSELRAAVDQLTASGLFIGRGTPPDASYLFKHALIQDIAYSTLLLSSRQQLHEKIAGTLERQFPERARGEPELLADHFWEAKQPERASAYWLTAGRQSAERSANLEAIRHLSRALEALMLCAEGEHRDRQELAIQTAIGTPLISVHGYAAPETGAAYGRAHILCERLGDAGALFATLSGEFTYHFVRGDSVMMRKLTEEARRTSEQTGDAALQLAGHRLAALTAMHSGAFTEARAAFETILRLYDRSRHRPLPVHYVHDPKMSALSYLAVVFWVLGYPEQARCWSTAAFEYADQLNQANLSAHVAAYGGAGLHELLGDAAAVRAYADKIVELADQHSLHYFRLSGLILRGWAMTQEGNAQEGLTLMSRTILERRDIGASWYQIRYLCMLAETYLQQGMGEAGVSAIVEAKSLVALHDEHLWEAEVERIEGELLRMQGASVTEVETRFQAALSVARKQGAKSFELRAAMSLASLWRDRGKRIDARNLLAPVYDRFTEGFDTHDLIEANVLLADA